MVWWLEFEAARGGNELEHEAFLALAIEAGFYEQPPQPEPLSLLYELRRFGLTYWEGAYVDQPEILMWELNTCIDAEVEVRNRQVAQLKAQEEFLQSLKKGDG